MQRTCAFTGHRAVGRDMDYLLLERVVERLIKNGYRRFMCGMAVGFDQVAAQCVLDFKSKYDVQLVACVPCLSQSETFYSAARETYERILSLCDEQIILSDFYFKGCMQQRDRFMVENSDALVCYLRKNSGGTFYTVNYAKERGKKIIEL